jgi:hypothetical protein
MERQLTHTSSREGLSKLLPKSISERRLRRSKKKGERDHDPDRTLESDGASIMIDDDDDSKSIDGRSFGSFESGPEPGSTTASSLKDSSATSRAKSRSVPYLTFSIHLLLYVPILFTPAHQLG